MPASRCRRIRTFASRTGRTAPPCCARRRWTRTRMRSAANGRWDWGSKQHGTPMRDVKDIVGTLMHVLDGGDLSPEQLADVGFEAEGELQTALNEAYIRLLEFAHDSAARPRGTELAEGTRSALQQSLDRIVSICERETGPA